jgi:hypothetical protein
MIKFYLEVALIVYILFIQIAFTKNTISGDRCLERLSSKGLLVELGHYRGFTDIDFLLSAHIRRDRAI